MIGHGLSQRILMGRDSDRTVGFPLVTFKVTSFRSAHDGLNSGLEIDPRCSNKYININSVTPPSFLAVLLS